MPKDKDTNKDKDKAKDKDRMLKRSNICYVFEKQRVRGHKFDTYRPHPDRVKTTSKPDQTRDFILPDLILELAF